jgi:hypothetical protein
MVHFDGSHTRVTFIPCIIEAIFDLIRGVVKERFIALLERNNDSTRVLNALVACPACVEPTGAVIWLLACLRYFHAVHNRVDFRPQICQETALYRGS